MNKEILRLAIPNIVSNISIPLLSSVDTALMGHISPSHLAALGIGGMIFMFLYSSFAFLRMGTTGMTAQAYGASDFETLSNTLYRAIFLALAISLLLLLLHRPLFLSAAYLMNIESGYYELAQRYFDIRILTAPAVMILYVMTGFFFGMQNSAYPLYITLLLNIVNIVASLFMVRVLAMGIEGAAWGTVIAQYSAMAAALVLLGRYAKRLHGARRGAIFAKSSLAHFFHINRNIFIRTLALTFSLAFFYAQAAKYGEETLSVMVILLQFMIWMSFAIDGFANAAESITGRYFGATERENFYKAVRLSMLWGASLALLFSLFYHFCGSFIVTIYTSDKAIIESTTPLLPLTALLPLLAFPAFIYDGIFIGMTAVKAMRDAVLLSMFLYMALFYLLESFMDARYALWISFVSFFLFRGLVQNRLFRSRGINLR